VNNKEQEWKTGYDKGRVTAEEEGKGGEKGG
jgi:hypothetical protein